jgi:hypothetical protein
VLSDYQYKVDNKATVAVLVCSIGDSKVGSSLQTEAAG